MPTIAPVRPVTLAEIREAHRRIASTIIRTPLVRLDLGPGFPDVRLKLENQSGGERRYTVALVETDVGALRTPRADWTLAAGKAVELPLFVDIARREFHRGQRVVHLTIADDRGWHRTLAVNLIGPDGAP